MGGWGGGSGVKLLLTCSSLLPMLILLPRDLADLTSALDFDDDTRSPVMKVVSMLVCVACRAI